MAEQPTAGAPSLVPPIVLADGLDVTMFRSVAEAEWSLEPWAVADRTLVGFDAEGRPLRFAVRVRAPEGRLARWLNVRRETVAIDAAPAPPAPETLRTLLRDFLRATGTSAPTGTELSELLAAAARVAQR